MKLKNLLFTIFALLLISIHCQAQDSAVKHIIRLAPTGLIDKIRLHYEYVAGQRMTFGTIGTYYYPNNIFPGIKGEIYLRIYFAPKAPEGWYFQPAIAAGLHQFNSTTLKLSNSFEAKGGTASIGFQTLMGKKKSIPMDFNIGVQLYGFSNDSAIKPGNGYDVFKLVFGWFVTGPGALVTPKFSIGYAF